MNNLFQFVIWDWCLGIGDWRLGPFPHPQSSFPTPPIPNQKIFNLMKLNKIKLNDLKIKKIKIYNLLIN